ncbi:16S rRNA (uracil(1498)-N(3))-methyltransferase [Rhodococcus aerolatus]
MSPPWFHHPDLPAAGTTLVLDGAEGRHAATVRRLRPGEAVLLTDGRGDVAGCTVAGVGRHELTLTVDTRRHEPAPTPRVTVVQALPKGERSELAVELATEAGADRLVPWQAARCVARWSAGDKAAKGVARWRAVADAAAKQSRRAWVPEVSPLHTTAEVAVLLAAVDVALVLHEEAAVPLASVPLAGAASVALVVGPEGGIGDDELAALGGSRVTAVHLGPTVLRTSTAAAVALGALGVLTDRWAQGAQS